MKKEVSLTDAEIVRESVKRYADEQENDPDRMSRALKSLVAGELTELQRRTVMMYYDRKMTMAEIAKEENVSESAVSKRLIRARKQLLRYLKYVS